MNQQFIAIRLNDQLYGIKIEHVSGIIEKGDITQIPNSPSYMEGIINLRGTIVPIINLKKKLNLYSGESMSLRIIHCMLHKQEVGFLVDDANQILSLAPEDIEATSSVLNGLNQEVISGIGKVDGSMVILLDLSQLIGDLLDAAQEE